MVHYKILLKITYLSKNTPLKCSHSFLCCLCPQSQRNGRSNFSNAPQPEKFLILPGLVNWAENFCWPQKKSVCDVACGKWTLRGGAKVTADNLSLWNAICREREGKQTANWNLSNWGRTGDRWMGLRSGENRRINSGNLGYSFISCWNISYEKS